MALISTFIPRHGHTHTHTRAHVHARTIITKTCKRKYREVTMSFLKQPLLKGECESELQIRQGVLFRDPGHHFKSYRSLTTLYIFF